MRNSFRNLLNILAACILALLIATPIVMGATNDDDLTEVKGASIIYTIVDWVESLGVTGLVIGILLLILVFIVGLFFNPKATLIGGLIFLVILVFVVIIWNSGPEFVNSIIKHIGKGYVMPARDAAMMVVFMRRPLKILSH